MKWLSDENGNKCSVKYFGSEEAAQKALDSLKGCENCTNCSYCSYCSGCSDCSDCSGCSDCSRCSDCSDCSYCSGCENAHKKEKVTADKQSGIEIPKIENIHQKVYEAASQPNALRMENWHTCDTTHCRAGWVVTLAGEPGKRLENFHNTELAAMLIYRESSDLKVSPSRFYDSNTEALQDMKNLAALEAARHKDQP